MTIYSASDWAAVGWVRPGRVADTCAYTDLLTWLAHPRGHEGDSTAAGDKLLRSHAAPMALKEAVSTVGCEGAGGRERAGRGKARGPVLL